MKKSLIAFSLILFSFGCQAANQEQIDNPRQIGVDIPDQEDGLDGANRSLQKNGYVRKLKSPNNDRDNHIAYLNRNEMADMISTLAVNLPDIDEAATLVTSEEVLVGYKTHANDRELAADQVRRTAQSVAPSFYEVYVSDEEGIIDDIRRFQNISTNSDQTDGLLRDTIQRMKQSPQGKNKKNHMENEQES